MIRFANVILHSETATRQDAFREWLQNIAGELSSPGGEMPDDNEIREHVLNRFRELRLQMLRDSDWAVLPDSPLGTIAKARYIQWRQNLRDLPQNYPDIRDAVWPEDPD